MTPSYSRNVRQNRNHEENKSGWGFKSKLEIYLCLALILLVTAAVGLFAYITLNRKSKYFPLNYL